MSHFIIPDDAVKPCRKSDAPRGIQESNHAKDCFGCSNPLGLCIVIDYGNDETLDVTGSFYISDHFQGGPGVIHGGLLSLAFDEVMGAATRLVVDHSVTGTLEITYHKPVLIRQRIIIKAHIEGQLRRKNYVTAQAYTMGDNPIHAASARAVFIAIDPYAHYAPAVVSMEEFSINTTPNSG